MEAEWTLHHKYELGEHLRYLFEPRERTAFDPFEEYRGL